jgi:hypothetical protein
MLSQNSKIKIQKLNSKFKSFAFLLAILPFAFCLLTLGKALAQQTPKGITVYPSIIHIDLAEDPPEYELTYINNTKSDIELNLSVQDFTQLENSYKINFLEKKDAANYKYSLSSWISFENKNLQLSPKEKKTVKVFIDNNRITKGGHYASILAEIAQPENKKQINIKAVISSLLFVRASTGQEIEEGKINLFKPSQDFLEYPNTYLLRFENSGNVHVIPYGLVEVYDPLGNKIARGILNENSLDAMPESIRNYEIQTTTYEKVLLPGFYTAKIALHFGKTDKKLSATVKFFSQGSFDFVKISLMIVGIAILLIAYKKSKRKR